MIIPRTIRHIVLSEATKILSFAFMDAVFLFVMIDAVEIVLPGIKSTHAVMLRAR